MRKIEENWVDIEGNVGGMKKCEKKNEATLRERERHLKKSERVKFTLKKYNLRYLLIIFHSGPRRFAFFNVQISFSKTI